LHTPIQLFEDDNSKPNISVKTKNQKKLPPFHYSEIRWSNDERLEKDKPFYGSGDTETVLEVVI
jgi:hypothetical protein